MQMNNYNFVIKYIFGLIGISLCFSLYTLSLPGNFSPRNNNFTIEEMTVDAVGDLHFENNIIILKDKYYRLTLNTNLLFSGIYYAFFVQFIYTILFFIVSFFVFRYKKKHNNGERKSNRHPKLKSGRWSRTRRSKHRVVMPG
jgi:hypothetical protein